MTLRMGDAVTIGNLPPGLDAVAGYVGGQWPTYGPLTARYPAAHHLSIAVNASEQADCLDIEAGDANPADLPGWLDRWHPGNTPRPVVYGSASAMAGIIGAAARPREQFLVWAAHYTNQPHICGPGTCGYPQADGTQWTDHGGAWDESLLADNFFTAPAPPPSEVDVPLTAADAKLVADEVILELKQNLMPGQWLYQRFEQIAILAVRGTPGPPEVEPAPPTDPPAAAAGTPAASA
jgi:hypothetical protein